MSGQLSEDERAELELLRDLRQRVIGFGGDDYTLMAWVDAHQHHHAIESYIGCPFCRNRYTLIDPEAQAQNSSSGVGLIAAERQRQTEFWTSEHDDTHSAGELAIAAGVYAMPYNGSWREAKWPLQEPFVHPRSRTREQRIRELVKAGALLAAEIDRLQRAT